MACRACFVDPQLPDFPLQQAGVLVHRPWRYYSRMAACKSAKLLLSIIELGGYPDFAGLYRELGYEVAVETRMRKAIVFLKKRKPDVIVAEFNFQSDFRDRSSNLESILAVVQRLPDIRVIIFYEKEFSLQFEKLSARLPVHKALVFPVDESALRDSLLQLAHAQQF